MGIRIFFGMTGCRPLTDTEIATLLTYLKDSKQHREKALITICLRTGLRLACCLSLRLEQVAVQGKVKERIKVRRVKPNGKRADYEMPLHPQAAHALQEYLDIRGGVVGYVFKGPTSKNRLSLTHAYSLIKKAFNNAGLRGGQGELASHTLRKTYARLLDEALGHELIGVNFGLKNLSLNNTISYLSFKEEEVDKAIIST